MHEVQLLLIPASPPLPFLPTPSFPSQDLQELEAQVKRLVDTIDQQSTVIGTLKEEVQQQREVSFQGTASQHSMEYM